MPTVNGGSKFVSRAEGKLAGAVRAFSFDFRDKVVLDIGSSTGGFTEFALRAGAKKVVAVEKGTKQMKAPLRFDPRVELHEKCDILKVGVSKPGKLTSAPRCPPGPSSRAAGTSFSAAASERSREVSLPGLCSQKEPFDVILADVSFTSLRPILLHARENLAGSKTEFLVMLKPQFEAREDQLVKGVVKNEKIRREIIRDFEEWLKKNGFAVLGKRDNEVVGKNGNQERFYYLKKSVEI